MCDGQDEFQLGYVTCWAPYIFSLHTAELTFIKEIL